MEDYELIESWINGNISAVVADVKTRTPSEIVSVAEQFVRRLGFDELRRLERALQNAEG